jgi:uncharacterized protein DUF3291
MPSPSWHVTLFNIARAVAPLDDPILADFVGNLNRINALADGTPGFVWRHQTASGNSTDERPYPDDRIIINFSVWEDVESLQTFTYRGDHVAIMRRRREWFQHMKESYLALWWIPAGTVPTVPEAMERLEHMRRHGPTADAFNFRNVYPPPGQLETS